MENLYSVEGQGMIALHGPAAWAFVALAIGLFVAMWRSGALWKVLSVVIVILFALALADILPKG